MSDDELGDIDELIAAFFAMFDNRDNRSPCLVDLEGLFVRGAVITRRDGDHLEVMTLKDFTEPRQVILTNETLVDFHEWEVESQTKIDGGIATRICAYSKEGVLNGEPFNGCGMKSIQLVCTEVGWKIVSVLWEDIAS